jgi:hypothetical protein
MINHFNTLADYAGSLQAALEISCDQNYSALARKVLGEFAADLMKNFKVDDHGATRIETRHTENAEADGLSTL